MIAWARVCAANAEFKDLDISKDGEISSHQLAVLPNAETGVLSSLDAVVNCHHASQ